MAVLYSLKKGKAYPLLANSGALGERRYSLFPNPQHYKEVSG
jgi:hypothetical protein